MRSRWSLNTLFVCGLLLGTSVACSKGATGDFLELSTGRTEFAWQEGTTPDSEIRAEPDVTIGNTNPFSGDPRDELVVFFPPISECGVDVVVTDEATGEVIGPVGPSRHAVLRGGQSARISFFPVECFVECTVELEIGKGNQVHRDTDGSILGPPSQNPGLGRGIAETETEFREVRVVNTASAPPPGPGPAPGPGPGGAFESNLVAPHGINLVEDAAGTPKLFVTGEDGSEILDWETGALETELSTVSGRDGTAAFHPDGALLYTVIVDIASGAVRFEAFDAATGAPWASPDFETQKWLLGSPQEPLVPVRLRDWIFVAPGAPLRFEWYYVWRGPDLDGRPTVQPGVRGDTVGAARRERRALVADPVGQDVLALHRNDGEPTTELARRPSGATENPANFFESIATVPGVASGLAPSGDACLVFEEGSDEAWVYRRGAGGDFTEPGGRVTVPAGRLDVQPGTAAANGDPRWLFLLEQRIVVVTLPDGGSPGTRDIPLPPGPTPIEMAARADQAAVLLGDGRIIRVDLAP